MRAYGWKALAFPLLLALVAVLSQPAVAAPLVSVETRKVSTDGFDGGAFRAGLQEWISAEDCHYAAHVMVRLDSERLRLVIGVPPDTPRDRAIQWLGELADEQGWQNASLSVNPQSNALYLRADVNEVVHRNGLGESATGIPLYRIVARLPELTSVPILAGVRLSGSQLLSATPPPDLQSRVGSEDFLFYRPQTNRAAAAAPLTVRYGIPQRWVAAAVVGFVIWLFFPLIVLFGARHYLSGLDQVEPRQRLVMYRRWQTVIAFVPALVAVGVVFATKGSFLLFFGRFIPVLIPFVMMISLFGVGFAARLVGLPLERAAWPDRPRLPWYRAAQTELIMVAVFSVMMLGVGLTTIVSASGGLRLPWGRGTLDSRVFFVLPFLFATGAIAWAMILNFRRKRGILPNEPPAPEPLATAVRELTHRLECPINDLRIGKRRDGLMAGAIVVLNDIAVVGGEIPELVEPDQLAALVAAMALTMPRTRKDKWITNGLTALILVPAAFILGALVWSPPGRSGSFPLFLIGQPFIFIGSMLAARRQQNRQQQADLRAAESLEDPLRFLQALRNLEEAQLSASGIDPSAAARRLPMTQRRLRLERKLGVE